MVPQIGALSCFDSVVFGVCGVPVWKEKYCAATNCSALCALKLHVRIFHVGLARFRCALFISVVDHSVLLFVLVTFACVALFITFVSQSDS